MKWKKKLFAFALCTTLLWSSGCQTVKQGEGSEEAKGSGVVVAEEEVPEYTGNPYVVVNDNEPEFAEEQLEEDAYEEYANLDSLGRCTGAEAIVGEELMPTEKRESISKVKPSGWNQKQYDIVDGGSLWNRCHLIAFQLTGENANEKNLITGTRYMNVEGMLPFEEEVGDYVRETGNHVMYRVTPIYEEDNLVASGVQMEAYSIEDEGDGVEYNVYVYNVQPGIDIDYETGMSEEAKDPEIEGKVDHYIVNKKTKKYHKPSCASVKEIKDENREELETNPKELKAKGYEPCGRCKP